MHEAETGRAMKSKITRFLNDDRGASVIEYSLIAAVVSVSIIVATEGAAAAIHHLFGQVTDALETARIIVRH
jgi:Flp pilus assembly pilin Flp